MTPLKYTAADLPETAEKLLAQVKSKTLLFYAEMGVGKTTLIKALVKQLGSTDEVSSPTFSLVNEYASPKGPIFHFDFYRIEDELEALDIGVEEYFDREAWVFVEWPEKIASFIPDDAQEIEMKREGDYNILKF